MDAIVDLLASFSYWQDARRELSDCYSSCEHSPGYFCYHQAEKEARAREQFREALLKIIDERIEFAHGR